MPIRIGLIHALLESLAPAERAFAEVWPEAEVINLYDGSLYADYTRGGQITPDITQRVTELIHLSAASGAAGILFTGSLFGEPLKAARASLSIPVLTAFEAMIEAAFAEGSRLGLLATVADTISMVQNDVASHAKSNKISYMLDCRFVEGAMAALRSGDRELHDHLVAEAASELIHCDALMLAQHSMGPARHGIAAAVGRTILTSPKTAAVKLKRLLTCPARPASE